MSGMGMMEDMDMMGMMGMGSMGGRDEDEDDCGPAGLPGASHVYHIGDRLLPDHPEHITLTTEQQSALNRANRRPCWTGRSRSGRSRRPSRSCGVDRRTSRTSQIQTKVQEIEKLRGEQRLAFIAPWARRPRCSRRTSRRLGNGEPQGHKAHTP
jgi:hypothetical protein